MGDGGKGYGGNSYIYNTRIGAELRGMGDWGKGKAEEDSAKVQIGAELLCKGAKGMTKTGWGVAGQIAEYGLQITEER